MADVTLTYKGSDILELSNSGSATLKTGGKYCEADIGVEYVKPSGGGDIHHESGTVSFHTGAALQEFSVPISSTALDFSHLVVSLYPIKTWALVNDEWVERNSLDFTGINGFKSGSWQPAIQSQTAMKFPAFNNYTYYRFIQQGQYSNGTSGSVKTGTFTTDTVSNLLSFPALNGGGYVCVTDGGLTFRFDVWGWN